MYMQIHAPCGSGMFGETSSLLDDHTDECATRVVSHKMDYINLFVLFRVKGEGVSGQGGRRDGPPCS